MKRPTKAIDPRWQRITSLTDAQYDIFMALGDGQRTRDIAAKRSKCSPKTIEAHIGHMKRKLGLPSVNALRCYAAKFQATVGRPTLSERVIERKFVFG